MSTNHPLPHTRYWVKYDATGQPVGVRSITGRVIPDQPDPHLKEVTMEEFTRQKAALAQRTRRRGRQ